MGGSVQKIARGRGNNRYGWRLAVRHILHIDMDAFFASVEQRDQPELRGKPVVVGHPGRRSVVCAASYEARPFGVRSAMPMGEALSRCPSAIVVAPRHAHYASVSRQVFAIFQRYTPLVEGLSLDEAFLDVTASQALFGSAASIAGRIRQDIRSELSLCASAGVATNKFVAKLASDLGKPDGLYVVPADPDGMAGFLATLPISRMWGVGRKTEEALHSFGIRTFGDLVRLPTAVLTRRFGSAGEAMQALAQGKDDRPLIADRDAKSIAAEETFAEDLHTEDALRLALLGQCERVAMRLLRQELVAHTVGVKLKLADFSVRTRQVPLVEGGFDTQTLHEAVCGLLDALPYRGEAVRLTGVFASDLRSQRVQQALFPDGQKLRREDLERVTSTIRDRFGAAALQRASRTGKGR